MIGAHRYLFVDEAQRIRLAKIDVALDDAGHAFLDGTTLVELRASTAATVVPVRTMPEVVNAILERAGSATKARGSRHALGRALAAV